MSRGKNRGEYRKRSAKLTPRQPELDGGQLKECTNQRHRFEQGILETAVSLTWFFGVVDPGNGLSR